MQNLKHDCFDIHPKFFLLIRSPCLSGRYTPSFSPCSSCFYFSQVGPVSLYSQSLKSYAILFLLAFNTLLSQFLLPFSFKIQCYQVHPWRSLLLPVCGGWGERVKFLTKFLKALTITAQSQPGCGRGIHRLKRRLHIEDGQFRSSRPDLPWRLHLYEAGWASRGWVLLPRRSNGRSERWAELVSGNLLHLDWNNSDH